MEKVISYLTYKVDRKQFATNVSKIQGIIDYTNSTKIPNMPDCVIGTMNLRNEVLTIIDLRIKLNVPQSGRTKNGPIIVLDLQFQKDKIGLLVDAVSDVVEIKDNQIEKIPEIGMKYNTNLIYGMYPSDDDFFMLLNVDKLFSSEMKV